MKYHVAYAEGRYFATLRKVWNGLTTMTVLAEAGFKTILETDGELEHALNKNSVLYQEELRKSNWAYDVVFESIRFRSVSMLHHIVSLPGVFPGLLGTMKAETLLFLKQYVKKLVKIESIECVSRTASRFLPICKSEELR